MPLKAVLTTAIILKLVGDTSIADIDLQVVTIRQLQFVVDQFTKNGQVLKNKINKMGMSKVKIPSIEWFGGEKAKLKGFLI